ncbi:hypothetical protein DFR50_14257 [Roseiarcus fermentans]|uniref:Gp37 protein n=1 Tax=Roseiarcus fermentans TaxID=1473586 RepID=A0A366EQM8_9HYPH|nr:hypothetical protein [Roseiarcus fermentans]RBP03809.1 hypothetical protein DFR50_14257 [Roseiarcus fermentans]
MATTREQAIEALFATLSSAYPFGAATRRLAAPEQLATPGKPGFGLVVHHEAYHRPNLNVPPRRTLTALAVIYVATGANPNGVPDALLNPIKDAFDAALAPDNVQTGTCTLGGLVFACGIRGDVVQAPGDKTGAGLAVIPIDIVLP